MTTPQADDQAGSAFTPPTDDLLTEYAVNFLENYAVNFLENAALPGIEGRIPMLRAIKAMKDSGEFQEQVNLKVGEAKRYAAVLISDAGYPPEQAWPIAIREKILERDPD